MRLRFATVLIILMLGAGCGGDSKTFVEDPARNELEAMDECLSEAIECIHVLTAPRPDGDDGEEQKMGVTLPEALRSVVATAQDLVQAATGQPIEQDAKALLSAAQELEKKGALSAAAIQHDVEELRSKVAA